MYQAQNIAMSDVYVKIKLSPDPRRQKYKSAVVYHSRNPVFNQEFTLHWLVLYRMVYGSMVYWSLAGIVYGMIELVIIYVCRCVILCSVPCHFFLF